MIFHRLESYLLKTARRGERGLLEKGNGESDEASPGPETSGLIPWEPL